MALPPTPAPPTRHRLRWLVPAGAVLLALGAALAWRLATRPPPDIPPPDPRLTYDGPFRNVHPDVLSVGDAACAGCHPDVTRTYAQHPMGRSLAPVSAAGPHPVAGRFQAFESLFRVERTGLGVLHRQTRPDDDGRPIYTHDLEAHFVVGSGTRGHSYLTDRDGFLFQTPMSWFSQKGVWDLSPQFTPAQLAGRPVTADCLFCHANRTHPREGTFNGFDRPVFAGHAIGCERCHGPGELHVRERQAERAVDGPADYSIVNPARLDRDRAEAVCQQCHLAGEARVLPRGRDLYDFRPGLPLEAFLSVFVRDLPPGEHRKAVNHVEQMHQSRCFVGGQLGCTSCHNPHERPAPERRVEFYRDRCLRCHQQRGCSVPPQERRRQQPQDSCIVCHMPRYDAANIAHTAVTDHRVVRRPEPPPRPGDRPAAALVPFGRQSVAGDGELQRDLGVALARLAGEGRGDVPARARRAADLLADAVRRWPADVVAWEARGQALAVLSRPADALAAFDAALARAPRRELSLRGAGAAAAALGDRTGAVRHWREAVEVNPQSADSRGRLAQLLVELGRWDEARRQAEAWLRLDPGSVEARRLWVRCLTRLDDPAAAAERDKLRRLR